MITAAITIWGILRDPASGIPSDHGRDLLKAISSVYRTVLLADSEDDVPWLRLERITEYEHVSIPRPGHPIRQERIYQINLLRASGPVALVIDPNPDICVELFRRGQPTLLYSHPRFAHLKDRPGLKSWAELERIIDMTRQRESQT